jgi:hypothetical protein
MAGLGWRRFQAGEVLTASNLQSYAVDQSVQVYAGTAARGSAIGTAVTEGMMSYLADSNVVQAYTGSWESLAYGSAVTGAETRITSLEGTRPGTSGKPFNMASGSLNTSAGGQTTVTYPTSRFNVTPNLVAQVVDNANVAVPYIITPSSTSFSIAAYTIGGARIAAGVQWMAIQMTSVSSGG